MKDKSVALSEQKACRDASSNSSEYFDQGEIEQIKILYQDEDVVAIHKASGLMTHKSRLAEDNNPSAMEILRDQLAEWVYPIHRLDRATSGILIFGKNKHSARLLHESLAQGQFEKTYWAVTRGHGPLQAVIDRALKEKKDRVTDKNAQKDKAPQPAYTEVKTLAHSTLNLPLGRYETARFSLIQAQPKTGRRHQIRRHLAGISYPIIGDTTHGRGEQNRFFRTHFSCHRLLLAAVEMSFPHPTQEKFLHLQAPLEGVMSDIVSQLFIATSPGRFTETKEQIGHHQVEVTNTWLIDPTPFIHLFASCQA